ncbi:MAG TPA: GntR family transcriptional regulator [Anaerolineaceae bacterium]
MNRLTDKIVLDFRSEEPLYLQISRQIEQLVAQGALKLGDQLPTVRELATELRINFNTVGRAYRLLDEARLISTQRGRGTYIWEEPSPETTQALRQKSLEEAARAYLGKARDLGYSPVDALQALQQILNSGDPLSSGDAAQKQKCEEKCP